MIGKIFFNWEFKKKILRTIQLKKILINLIRSISKLLHKDKVSLPLMTGGGPPLIIPPLIPPIIGGRPEIEITIH